jgi:hypothetical protein
MMEQADASPTKRLFLEMLTKDISLQDAILDLVDNSIDSALRSRERPLSEILNTIFESAIPKKKSLPIIDITLNRSRFALKDECGGISRQEAIQRVFRFGNDEASDNASLSVYGIGLKRAIFKISKHSTVISNNDSPFIVTIDVDEWLSHPDDWHFPLNDHAVDDEWKGTIVECTTLREISAVQFDNKQFLRNLQDAIERTYSFFIGTIVEIRLNGQRLDSQIPPFSQSASVIPAIEHVDVRGVSVLFYVGLTDERHWKSEFSGWYVLCNGRVVVYADKTNLTGFGMPSFQPKFRGFLGMALLVSDNPEALPWTTTKRGVDPDSLVYRDVQAEMIRLQRPVLDRMNERYEDDDTSSPSDSDVQLKHAAAPVGLSVLATKVSTPFSFSVPSRTESDTVNVLYQTKKSNIETARLLFKRKSWSAKRVGVEALKRFITSEGESYDE